MSNDKEITSSKKISDDDLMFEVIKNKLIKQFPTLEEAMINIMTQRKLEHMNMLLNDLSSEETDSQNSQQDAQHP